MDLEPLIQREYPGRFIIAGTDPADEFNVIVYGITGRSDFSRARKLTKSDEGTVKTEVTDEEILRKGRKALLLYTAFAMVGDVAVVSNGDQTTLVQLTPNYYDPEDILHEAFAEPVYVTDEQGPIDLTSYEPDSPIWTPRICAAVRDDRVAFWRSRRGFEEENIREMHPLSLKAGEGWFLATYNGNRDNPKPSLASPLDLEIPSLPLESLAQRVYDSLNHELRVSVMVAYIPLKDKFDPQKNLRIINRE